jgi:DNA-binding NarL/FixJ family response regulator
MLPFASPLGPGLFEKAIASTSAHVKTISPPLELAQLTPRELEVLKLIAAGSK